MAAPSIDPLLAELEKLRDRFEAGSGSRAVKLLSALGRRKFHTATSLIRFHEALLFLRAFPHNLQVVRVSEDLLRNFSRRVQELQAAGADMDEFDPLEVSGIAGTAMQDTLSFDVVRWLVARIRRVEIVWDEWDAERASAAVWPIFMPLLEDDGYVEADVPWQKWLRTASDGKNLEWLVQRFEALTVSDSERAQRYDSLRFPVCWRLDRHRLSRTRNWTRVRRPFYQTKPLTTRRDVFLPRELAQAPPTLRRLPLSQGKAVMHMIREVMLVRYRELYGTTLGDPRSVRRADVGRGVSIYLWNLPPERRLPLRAYVAGFTLKNGVPINYIEAIGLFEWIEMGFNTFYTFRGGEVAWIYAQVLRCLCRLTGATCISMYPYQLGHGNDEAIESGAFWFYRKLGFRPGRADLLALTEREEEKMARDRKHRTSTKTLRRLAEGHVFYELAGSEPGAWDRFSTRNIGMKVNQRMARQFKGNEQHFRKTAAEWLARLLDVSLSSWSPLQRASFETLAMVLSLVPEVVSWDEQEKRVLVQIIRAQSAANEMRYLKLTQKHPRLRQVLLKLGS